MTPRKEREKYSGELRWFLPMRGVVTEHTNL